MNLYRYVLRPWAQARLVNLFLFLRGFFVGWLVRPQEKRGWQELEPYWRPPQF